MCEALHLACQVNLKLQRPSSDSFNLLVGTVRVIKMSLNWMNAKVNEAIAELISRPEETIK